MNDRIWERTHKEPCDCPTCTRAVAKAREQGRTEGEKAFGGCKNCYGKGYTTVLQYAEGGHGRSHRREKLPIMRFCRCSRGKQLKMLLITKTSL